MKTRKQYALVTINYVDGTLGLNFSGGAENFKCETCDKSKMHQSSYTSSTTKTKEKLGLVYSDICGPMSSTSFGGSRYFTTFVDDKTRYTKVIMLKNRHETFNAFKKYKQRVEKETGS